MDTGVIEVVVNAKKNMKLQVLQVLLIVIGVLTLLLGLMGSILFAVIGVAALVGAYFAGRDINLDYEYSLVDRELRLAKIRNKSTRKSLGMYDLDKMEILAPENSYHLDNYKNRKVDKDLDYSTHDPADKHRYVLYMDQVRLTLTFNGEEAETMLRAIRQFAPRKVFYD